jgi:hypothetical protein
MGLAGVQGFGARSPTARHRFPCPGAPTQPRSTRGCPARLPVGSLHFRSRMEPMPRRRECGGGFGRSTSDGSSLSAVAAACCGSTSSAIGGASASADDVSPGIAPSRPSRAPSIQILHGRTLMSFLSAILWPRRRTKAAIDVETRDPRAEMPGRMQGKVRNYPAATPGAARGGGTFSA